MKAIHPATLRLFVVLFLVTGLAGLAFSSMLTSHYLNDLPRTPVREEQRTSPRSVDGMLIYQTPKESHDLNLIEYTSAAILAAGLLLGAVYLEHDVRRPK